MLELMTTRILRKIPWSFDRGPVLSAPQCLRGESALGFAVLLKTRRPPNYLGFEKLLQLVLRKTAR